MASLNRCRTARRASINARTHGGLSTNPPATPRKSGEMAPPLVADWRINIESSGGEAAELGDVFAGSLGDGAGGLLGIFLREEGEMTCDRLKQHLMAHEDSSERVAGLGIDDRDLSTERIGDHESNK